MDTEVHNQEPTTETIVHKTSSESELEKHGETVLKHYEAKNVKDHIEGDNIDKLTSVDEPSSENLPSSSSELGKTVEICDNTEDLDGKQTEDQVSKSLGVKETEGQLSTNSDERKMEDHHVEKGERNSPQEIPLITKETVGEGHEEHNLVTDQEAEVYESELTEENKVENLSNDSITMEGTEKITNIEPVIIEDHISRTSPEEDSRHRISSGTTEKELDIASASEDVPSKLEETECRGDTKEEITNTEKIGCETSVDVTLQSEYLKESNKEEAKAVESSSGITEIASLDGESEKVVKARSTESNLPQSPRDATKDETIDISSTAEKPPFNEKNVSAADVNEKDEIHLYETAPPVVHETGASEGTQLSVEEPKVMHDIDEANRKLDSSDLGRPLTEGASGMDLAPPCQIDAENLETKSNMNSIKELEIIETNTEDEDQNADSLVESHNIFIANDANSKVTKEEIEFDSSNATLSDEKRDELNVQESEHRKDPQMEEKSEATGLRNGKESDMNDATNHPKSEEHVETDTLDKEAEEIYSDTTDREHTTQIFPATLTTEESKVLHKTKSITEANEHPESTLKLYEAENGKASNTESSDSTNIDEFSSVGNPLSEKLLSSSAEVNKSTGTDNGTKLISESLQGKEIQGELLEGSDKKETEGQALEGSEGKETESGDRKSLDGKETQDHHVEKDEWKSAQEIQTNTEEILGKRHIGTNGGIAPEETDIEEVEISELTSENDVENVTKAIKLDNTEMITGVEPVTFEDDLYKPSVEENTSQPISSSMVKKEIYVSSETEDPLVNLEDTESRAMEEDIMNHEKIGYSDPANVTLESDLEKGEEINSDLESALNITPIKDRCFTSSSERDVTSFGVKGKDEQSETEEKERNTDINLPEVPAEGREDEKIDAISEQENQPFDEKNVSAADLNEEDEIHLYETAHPVAHETDVSEGTQPSVEEPKVMHDIDEADRALDISDLGRPLTEGASGMDLTPPCQIDADNLETKLNMKSKKELEIGETNTEDEDQNADSLVGSHNISIANDADSKVTNQETEFDSSSTTHSDEKREELNVQESEHSKDLQMDGKSEATGLTDEKESNMNDETKQDSKSEEHGETDTVSKEAEEICSDITDKEHSTQSYSPTLTTEESMVCQENETQVLHKTTSITEPDEHPESMLKLYEAENGKVSNPECSDNANIDELSSVGIPVSEKLLSSSSEVNKSSETDNGTEQISEIQGEEIQGELLEGSDKKGTVWHALEGSEGNETESVDRKSLDEKETQDHHVEKGEWKSTEEIQTITEEVLVERHIGPNGGIAPDETDIEILVANSHQNVEVEVSELTSENDVENVTKGIKRDKTAMITGVEHVTFEDHLYRSSVEENSGQPISSSMVQKEIYVPSASEDPLVNLEDNESRAMEEEIGHSHPVYVTLESDHVSKEDMEKVEEINSNLGSAVNVVPIEETCFTSSSATDVTSFGIKGNALLDEQCETEQKARDTEINLPEVPAEAGEDDNIDASSKQENQPFDEKNISADDLKEEDGTNQHDQTKGQPDAPPLVRETEVCEENQVSADGPEETHGIDEADRVSGSSNLGLMPIEGASNKNMIHQSQIDAGSAETKIDSTKESRIIAESNTKDNLQENDDAEKDSIEAETNFDSASTIPTAKITDELNTQESEYGEDSHMEEKSLAKGELGDGKELDTNKAINHNSELQGHGETDTFKEDEEIPNITDKQQCSQIFPTTLTTEEFKKTNEEAARECKNPEFNSLNMEEGAEDEPSASIREKDLLDSPATPEEVCAADTSDEAETNDMDSLNIQLPTSIVEKVEENQEIVQENADSTKPEEIMILEKEGKEQNLDVTHHVGDTKAEAFISESSQVPEEIENNAHIIQTAEETKEDGPFEELHSVSEPDIPSHDAKDISLVSLQSIDITDSNDKAEERPVPPAENPKTEEEPSVTEAPEETKEGKEQVQDMKSISLQNIENKDSDEKPEESIIQLAENSNTEKESSTSEVDTINLDEKLEEKVLQLADNSNPEQETSTTEVAKETTEDKENIQDMTNMRFEKSEVNSSHNFVAEVDDYNDKADALVKKESSLTDVHVDEKTVQVYCTDIDDENPSRVNFSSLKDEQVEIRHPEQTSGAVYQTEPSETKEIISETIMMETPDLNEASTEMESKYSIDALSETIQTPKEQENNTEKSQQHREGKEETYGMIHGDNDNVEVVHITPIQKKEESSNELQETSVVQPMEEQEHETLDSIKETIHEDGVVVGVSSMKSSLLNNNSNTLESTLSSVEGMCDQSTMEEENIHNEKSEETGEEMSSPNHNCSTSENSMRDVDNETVVIEELHESKEATDLKSDMSPAVLESETELHHAEVPGETEKGTIKEESLQAEIEAENIPKEEMPETGSTEDNISRAKFNKEDSDDLERDSTPEEPQSITIEEVSETTKKEENHEKDQEKYEANTSDVRMNEVSITNVLKDIEMMPESHTTAQTETQKQQTTDDSNDVPEATNSNPELKSTSVESKTIDQEATGIRSVNEPTLDLTQEPTDNDLSAADKGESVAQISEVHDDHVITDEAEKEDTFEHEKSNNIEMEIGNSGNLTVSSDKGIEEGDRGESKPLISSNDKDIPLLESVSTTVTDIEEVKQVYPPEAVPDPNSTGSAENEGSHDHEWAAGSPGRTSELGHRFAEENIFEPGDSGSQEHDKHILQHVQESSMESPKGSIKDVEELTLTMLSKSDSLSTPGVDPLIVSSPNDSREDAQMPEKIAAEDIEASRETLECAESSFEESKGEGNRTTDELEETTERLLSTELSGESTWEKADHSGEKIKLITQPAAGEVNPEDSKVEKGEHIEQKEGNSGSGVIFNGEKGPDDNGNKITEPEVDMSSTIYSNELITMQEDPEECTEHLIEREGVEQKTDETNAEREEPELWKGENPVSEAFNMSEKDVDGHTIDTSVVEDMKYETSRATPDDTILVQGSPEDHIEKAIYSEDKEIKTDQDEAVKEEQEDPKEGPGAEIPLTGEKNPSYYNSNRITTIEMKDESPSTETDDRSLVHEDPRDCTNTMIFSEEKEAKAYGAEVDTGDRDVQKEKTLDSEDAVVGKKDSEDNQVSVEEKTEDLKETVSHTDNKGVNPDSMSGVTYVEKEKLIPINNSEAVAESESPESAEQKTASNDYKEKDDTLQSTLSSKAPQTNQGQDSADETKLNAGETESSATESLHAAPHITGLSTETLMKAGDSDTDISWKNQEKQEKHVIVEADQKGSEEPGNANNALQLEPSNSNNEKTTSDETKEGDNVPSEKDGREEDISVQRFPEAKKEEIHAKNTGSDKDEEDEERNEHEELQVRTEASRDAEVKVSPKKSHNLFSGVISKMKKAITCTNAQPMPQSPR